MRRITGALLLLLVPSLLVAGTGLGLKAGKREYKLNDAVGKNSLTFVSEAPMETINGTADAVSGSFFLDTENLEAVVGTISVPVKSMKSGISKRDGHMYSSTWLDADKYPTITYQVTSLKNVTKSSSNGKHVVNATAVGTFTLHGKSVPLTSQITLTFLPESSETKKRASGNLVLVNATFDVALDDYGIKGKEGVVGSSVGSVIRITTSLYANS